MCVSPRALLVAAALVCLSAGTVRAESWAHLNGNTLSIGVDSDALNTVLVSLHGDSKIKVATMGLQATGYGGITVVYERNFYFPLSQVQLIDIHGSNKSDLFVNDTAIPSMMTGKDGHDILVGGSSNDILIGGPGNDELYGREGRDDLSAGAGEDGNHGGPGHDVLDLGGDSVERFQIGDSGKDGFVRYGTQYGSRFIPDKVTYTLEQSQMEELPEVVISEDYFEEEGDYRIDVTD